MKRIKSQLISRNISRCTTWDEVFGQLSSVLKGVDLENLVEVRIRPEGLEIKEVA